MLPAVGLAIEALGAEALTPELMSLAELATEADGGDLHLPLRSSWLDSFDYELATSTLTVNMQDGGSYEYPGTTPMHHRPAASMTATSNSQRGAPRCRAYQRAGHHAFTAFDRGKP
jgi:hypothetical protein